MMFRVERAVILAAGKGKRMKPVSEYIPKPLIEVNGVGMIDSIITSLHDNGINEIYVVVGYLAEKFSHLESKYGVKLVYNKYFDKANNISSLYVAREHLENCLITDGDILVSNSDVYSTAFDKSGYCAVWTDRPTGEWILEEKDGLIISCDRNGGDKGWQLFSISRWNAIDGKKLKKWVEEEFEVNKNTDIYWDDIPMFIHLKEMDLGIRPLKNEDFMEIDDFEELVRIDNSYTRFLSL